MNEEDTQNVAAINIYYFSYLIYTLLFCASQHVYGELLNHK